MTETKPRTFEFDTKIGPLPVPALEETCARYLTTVEPLVDAATFESTKKAVAEVLAPGSLGRQLHDKLVARAAKMDNWLAGWWEKAAYLGWQDSILIGSNIGISCDARHAPGDQAKRAAQLTGATLDIYLSVVNETYPPEVQKDGTAFDMSLWKRYFSTVRFPGTQCDRIATYGIDESRHIVVVRHHHLYRVDVLSSDGKRVSDGELMLQFQRIIAAADAAPAVAPVAVLTAERRDVWSNERDRLSLDPGNRSMLDRIDRALFLVALDTESHDTFEKLALAGLVGQKGNRWHDKNFHLVVDKDGRFTLHGEHSPVDAGCWVPMIDAIGSLSHDVTPAQDAPQPVELTFKLSPETLAAIDKASALWDGLVGDLDLRNLHFTDFGKNEIKTFKTGPDPVCQMAFELAYWRLHKRIPKTYEAASTRMYRGGRTETIRTASPQSRAFVTSFDDPAYSDKDREALMRAAFAEHNKRGKDASAGQGVDRHLLGMKMIAIEEGLELPALWKEEVYTRGWELSTAQLPMRVGFVNHFGAVCPQGYGIGYIIKDDHINLNVTSYHAHPETSSSKYIDAVAQALRDIADLCRRTS